MERRRITALTVLLVLAGVLYSAWVAEFFLDTGLDPAHSFLSELDAADQPYRHFFSTADLVTGVLLIVAGAAGLTLPRRRLTNVGWSALVVFGAATIADSQLPIECVAGNDPSCPVEPSGLFPQLHHIHALTSTVAVFAVFTAMVAFTVAAFRYRILALLRTVGLVVLIVTSLATAWLMIADNLPGSYGLGIAQRLQVTGMSLYLLTLGFAVRARLRSADT
ncbi:DUF998 domain-containing protein [Rhodococcus sp. 14-2470-1a]|uniref:DUF998 domain-containing protein n=1 Tax=Rhodococcus sp. 14-2470-1a TaxID=2023150 RepID=UPI000B9AD79F|nr:MULTISPECIES: DUF998 domain-containing protein [unclassified Rhodococcus (in: high G+C Gram-positive bacteria)]OZF05725.1 hypothetical protein CH300_10750 [Rhodococcus sp. 15-1154-1]OZF48535.1 hypothetical protein CH292_16130 [Rhodococcus sp. 14-2470-1a]